MSFLGRKKERNVGVEVEVEVEVLAVEGVEVVENILK